MMECNHSAIARWTAISARHVCACVSTHMFVRLLSTKTHLVSTCMTIRRCVLSGQGLDLNNKNANPGSISLACRMARCNTGRCNGSLTLKVDEGGQARVASFTNHVEGALVCALVHVHA